MGYIRIHSVLLGLLIIALGAGWLLRNLGVIDADIGRRQGFLSASGAFGLILVVLGVTLVGRHLGL
ncbi:MAG: hypothetical protein ACM3X3_10580 [Betaproteobacteria bacterium]